MFYFLSNRHNHKEEWWACIVWLLSVVIFVYYTFQEVLSPPFCLFHNQLYFYLRHKLCLHRTWIAHLLYCRFLCIFSHQEDNSGHQDCFHGKISEQDKDVDALSKKRTIIIYNKFTCITKQDITFCNNNVLFLT